MPSPRYLFRYRTLSAYSLADLINGTMWFAKPDTFNDPFDCALTLDREKLSDSIQHVVDALVERGTLTGQPPPEAYAAKPEDAIAYERVRALVRSATANLGLCCLSATCRSILLWSHYANNHKGFCVQYSFAEGTALSSEAEPVIYSAKMPRLSIADLAPKNRDKTIELLWRAKAPCWRYEKEWRVLAPEGNKSYPARSPVVSVIFGARMSAADRTLLATALRGTREVRLKEASLDQSSFVMRIRAYGGA
jgi:Protein of unknown function (DUF2971)